jgi:predicted RNase H-like HicB family nuclease
MEERVSETIAVPAERRTVTYTAVLTPGEDGWICAQALELPEAISQGRTLEEAKTNLAEALEAALAWRVDEGEPIPPPGQVTVSPITVAAPHRDR